MVNKAILIGNLGQDPEIRNLDNGSKLATFSLATSESWKDKNGDRQSKTTWLNCEVWGAQSDIIEKYTRKGSKLYIEGKIKIDEYEKNGEKRFATKIVVNNFTMLDSKPDSQTQQRDHNVGKTPDPQPSDYEEEQDDLPF